MNPLRGHDKIARYIFHQKAPMILGFQLIAPSSSERPARLINGRSPSARPKCSFLATAFKLHTRHKVGHFPVRVYTAILTFIRMVAG